MGNFFRLAVFIFALGTLVAGTGALLLHERQRAQRLERALFVVPPATPPPAAPDPADAILRLRAHHTGTQRALLLFGGLAFVCVIVIAVTPGRTVATSEVPDPRLARSELRGMETLARATAAQRVELDQEREARHRSEQNLTLQQLLANRALQDKVRLGRDLHDGLVQTLYATGLVLETAVQRLAAEPPPANAPADAARLIDRAKTTLNAAIRQVRGTIGELTPDAIETHSFPAAIDALLDHLDGDRLRARRVALAPELPGLSDAIYTELLQIIRESVSNALRHGEASEVEIDFAPLPDARLRLAIRDNGRGFDPGAITRGHGLDNLAARARALDATLDIDSVPGRGTTLVLTLPPQVPALTRRNPESTERV